METKYILGVKVVTAMAISMIAYAILNPVITIYSTVVAQGYTCPPTNNEMCLIIQPVVSLVIPIFAIFFVVFSIFEVFIK